MEFLDTVFLVAVIVLVLFGILAAIVPSSKGETNKDEIMAEISYVKEKSDDVKKKIISRCRTLQFTEHKFIELSYNYGLQCEEDGNMDDAIKFYNECLSIGRPATHVMDRILGIFENRGDYENAINSISIYIDAIKKVNDEDLKRAINIYPEFEDEIIERFKRKLPFGRDGFVVAQNYPIALLESTKMTLIENIQRIKKSENTRLENLDITASLNNKGIALEKKGRIEDAIRIYEQCISHKYPATHSFNRLMILYRKKKDFEKELMVINSAIDVFMSENEKRVDSAMKQFPEYKDEIWIGLETNKTVRDKKGMVLFSPYDVMDLITRKEKVLSLISKNMKIAYN